MKPPALSPTVREDEILATAMRSPEAMSVARVVLGPDGDALTVGGNSHLWEALVGLHDAGRSTSELSALLAALEVSDKAKAVGGVGRLQWLLGPDAPRVTQDRLASLCREQARYSAALSLRADAAEIAKVPDVEVFADPEQVHARAEALRIKAGEQLSAGLTHPGELATRLTHRVLDRKRTGGPAAAPTGITPLDKILGGGLQSRRPYVFAGRPAMGKTSLGLQAACYMAERGHPVAYFSREMSGEDLADRAAQIMGRLEGKRPDDEDATKIDASKWMQAVARFGGLHAMRVDDAARDLGVALGRTRAWLRSTARPWMADRPDGDRLVPVVFLDYLQKFTLAGRWTSRQELVAAMSVMLADFALDEAVAVVMMCQINRDSAKVARLPQMEDLRESGAIEQDARALIFIHRDTTPENADEVVCMPAKLVIPKNTFGPIGLLNVGWRPRSTRFESDPPVGWEP